MEPDGVEPAAHRRPVARDRLWVHVVWEILLAAGVVAAVLAVRHEDSGALSGNGLRDLLVLVAIGILLGSAFALSLRAAVPNLAVGAVAVMAGVLPAWLRAEHGYDLRIAVLITLGASVALGLVAALLVVGFRLPAWALSLGAAFGLWAAMQSLSAGHSLLLDGGPNLRDWAWPLAIGAAALSVLGGVLGLLPRARLTLGQYRHTGDPAAGRGSRAGLTATAALVGSMLLAAGAGVLLALRVQAVVPDDGFTLLGEAAAAAFLGGTSAYGRRGGVFGTVLAAGFLQLAALWLGLVEAQPWTRPALLGGAIVLGLLVGRVVEAAGTVEPPPDEADEDAGPETQLWDPYGTGSFARPGDDPYPTGGFTPASAYRPDAEPYWPGQAPVSEDEPTAAAEPGGRDLGAYREPGSNLGPFREQGRGSDR
jgi:ribose/xylose/arabinose/galactoside ABC-type transport system permease subunit